MSDYQMFVDGKWCEAASGESYATYNPATGEKIADIAKGGREDAQRAIAAARRAFDEGPWPRMDNKERAGYVRAIGEKIMAKQQELATLESMDSGGTIRKAMLADVGTCAATFLKFAEYAETVPDYEDLPDMQLGPAPAKNYLLYEPIGVCGQITPWNFPLVMASWKIAPAIAAGNTIVLKPASITSLTAIELARIAEEVGLPPGVFNLVPGPGGTVGEELASNPMVDKVAFTGSTEVGARIMQLASSTVKKVTLELGGKSASIVTDDVGFELAAKGVLWGTFFHNGQVCESGTRALVNESVYDDFLDVLVDKAKTLKLGNPLDFASDLGPLVSTQQLDTVERYVNIGKEEGAKLVVGGSRPEGEELTGGCYYKPTIFADVDNSMKIAQEEIFGPVLSVIKVADDDDAVRVANDSMYGLAGAVWCQDLDRAKRIAERMRTGTVWINEHHLLSPEHPFGGYKQSGIGSEMGVHGYNEYRLKKRIHVESNQDPATHMTFSMLFSS
jgi:aldehyde dehydrogenase (NAD+)